ncbi:MAG TPA: LysR family transcriptional regulator [Solirubrobacteraceae bacterium]|nr:LysR family transcriptional regulator [Solirubrobacteraceae bacterium]
MWPELDMREVRAFLMLSEELHFARTAERLGLTPSRVSQMIRSLESRLGGRLFERTSRRVRLTPMGERLRAEIAHPYRELQVVLAHARQAAAGVDGTLRIGVYSLLSAGPHMTDIARTFKTRHPACRLEFINISYDRGYLDALRGGEADMLATRLPLAAPGITIGPILSREERILLVATNDPLAQRGSISYEELADRVVSDVSAFPRDVMDAFIPPATRSGRILKRLPNHSAEDTMMRVALGEQVHPTVRSFLDHHSHPGVTWVPITDLPPSETALVWLIANLDPKIEAFVHAADDVLARTDLATRPHGPGDTRLASRDASPISTCHAASPPRCSYRASR